MVATAQESQLILSPDVEIDTPALIVSEEILHRNIAGMASFAKSVGVGLRPHIKTHKTPQIARLQIAAGAIGITCAKVGEAEVMVNEAGVEDVLLAYPTIGESKYRRIVELMEKARIIVALDSLDAAKSLSASMARHDRVIDVFIEVNTGQNRSGVMAGDEAVAFALQIARQSNLKLAGIMTHEGHVNSLGPDEIEAAALEAGKKMVDTAERIREHGLDLPTVSVGSTPAARITPTVPGITEARPGTYVFNDNSLLRFGDQWMVEDCAARFVATVVSRTAPDRCILDTGSKSLAMDPSKGHAGHGYIVGHPDVIISKLSEEHGACELPEGEPGFEVGDRVEVIPNHVCPTVNLMDEMTIVRNGQIVDHWKIAARGKVR
ncbi:MAG TPA: alanine racemase [Thermomicrobiales bacterium]|nr:alanine racemase [Thermomicrobiales bacterium]